ncbi:MAG: cytochrome b N-terminal domain-containing protein [Bacteroidales bacterium]|jgi:quinol-cytochrome oxidoreductase complex cytochrome b subunit|nr:cytochrome b N-terminal domain-containing protein [Bacteroidales bacterium]
MNLSFPGKIGRFTFGAYATASFLICALSGLVLIIPYEIEAPYLSISNFLLDNPGAVFFRNLHYWSAQFFFVFSLVHIWDHLKKRSHKKIQSAVWLRLSLGVLVLFFAMIGGFILKGDADSLQAWQILNSLISALPFFGETIAYSLMGPDEQSLLILYIHHIATFTILLFIILFEHVRTIWPRPLPYIYSLIVLSLFSLVLNAPLHDNISPIVKGPWYFVGFQEILHWMSNPTLFIWIIIASVVFLFLLKYIPVKAYRIIKNIALAAFFFYLVVSFIAYFLRGEEWQWKQWGTEQHQISNEIKIHFPWPDSNINIEEINLPTILDRKEGCIVCHNNFAGFSPAHNPEAIGCASCHLGNPFSLNKKTAHKNMLNIPGNLSNASLSCSSTQCHPNEHYHITNSLMSSLSGLIAVDKFVFDEIDSPDSLFHIKDLEHSPADKHMRDLCASCHLGNDKREIGPINQKSRGGGCLACHLNYNEKSHNSLAEYKKDSLPDKFESFNHPSLSLQLSNDHCFGCHSRSGRISTNYEGWHETRLKAEEMPDDSLYRLLDDLRVFEKKPADVHHTAGLLCVDCHTYSEVMGDGNKYFHKEEAVKIACEDCHSESFSQISDFASLPAESKVAFTLRNQYSEDAKIALSNNGNYPLINVRVVDEDSAYLTGKKDGLIHELKKPSATCAIEYGHSDLSCSSCHSSWAPQCVGCHNSFDENSKGFDLLDRKKIIGEWKEFVGIYLSDFPALGIRENDTMRKIETAVPGMIMTIDKESFYQQDGHDIFLRLYAPTAAHTTQRLGQNCTSCHLNSVSLGYGRGTLDLVIEGNTGTWNFTPRFANRKEDNLPEDAWIGFLSDKRSMPYSTRSDFRPFTLKEQKQILNVGACLTCHKDDSNIMKESLHQPFEEYLKTISSKCIIAQY